MKFSYLIKDRLTPRHSFIMDFCANLAGKTILDIGCSFGWFEKLALEKGAQRVVGLETEEKNFFNAKKEIPQAEFKIGTAESLPFKNASFDLVIMLEVLEHIPKNTEAQALKEIHRVLSPGGTLILSTPNFRLINCLLDPAWLAGHRHYRLSFLKNLFSSQGFEIEKTYLYGGFWEMFRMVPHYIFKWVFHLEDPFKKFFEKKMLLDQKRPGSAIIYIRARKK